MPSEICRSFFTVRISPPALPPKENAARFTGSSRTNHRRSVIFSSQGRRNLFASDAVDVVAQHANATGAKEKTMADKDLKALLIHQLKDTFYAENAILKALPKLAQAAQSEELKGAFGVHVEETKKQVDRLKQVFKLLGEKPEGVKCPAIDGIIEEGEEVMEEFGDGDALDAGLIASAQAVEHYEIVRYGTMLAWAKQLGLGEVEELLKETLVEEENTDEILSELAEDTINAKAA
jgi:ferritin-like metal-binding protein YciE